MGEESPRSLLLGHPLMKGLDGDQLDGLLHDIPVKEVPRGMLLNTPGISPGPSWPPARLPDHRRRP